MKQLFYCSLLLVFLFASCTGKEAGEPDPNPDPGETRTVQFDLSSLSSAAAASLGKENLTFLFYQDGSLLLRREVDALDASNSADVIVPLDEATRLIVVAGGTIKNPEKLETLELTTGDNQDQELFATAVTSVQTHGGVITLTMNRLVGKAGIVPTDSEETLAGASFDALDVIYRNMITSYLPGAEQQYVYQTLTRRTSRADGFRSAVLSIAHPSTAEEGQLAKIDIDFYAGGTLIGQMADAQPLSGFAVKSSIESQLKLSLVEAYRPVVRSSSAAAGAACMLDVEF